MIRTTLIASAALAATLAAVVPALADSCSACTKTKTSFVSAEAKAVVGQPAPDFKLMDQAGNAVSLSDFKGKIVVLEQFNDQCPFVKKFYKNGDMNQMAADLKAKGVVWLAIDSSNFSSVEENAAIAAEWNIDRPILDDHAGTVGKQYTAKTTPHMFVIDQEGILAYAGAIDSIPSTDANDIAQADNYVAMAVDALLNGETVSPAETKPYGCSVKF
ncbi:MAG: redoxin domain-containing protein [Planctomycetota bacterium]